jgi:succinate dehydrogenase / fumarate reductase flavoprotein subunit
MAKRQVAVVGGGLGGLMTTMKLAEAGVHVDLFSLVPVKRSHSVCAQGGINGAVNTKGEGDSPWIHFDDTIYGGDFLANQPPVLRMCERAPAIIYLLDRMGVPFNRTPEGLIDFRRFGGTRHHRTAFSGSTTGQQLLYALDEQVRRWEVEGRVTKYEGWEFLGLILDENGVCRGLVAQDLRSMEIRAFREEAVVIATGGPGMIFKNTTNSIICTGSAASICYQQGAYYANGEFIQIHPTAIPGEDKCRLISEAVRGEGGRVWVPKDPHDSRHPRDIPESDRWYFLEEKYPAYGNLVPRDIATREIFDVCVNQRRGIQGKNQVYLDITHLPRQQIEKKLLGILEVYIKFVGRRPARSANAHLPRAALLDGRAVGGLRGQRRRRDGACSPAQPDDQHSGAVRCRRGGLPVSRRKSAGRELAAELLVRRRGRRARHRGVPQVAGDLRVRPAQHPLRAGAAQAPRAVRGDQPSAAVPRTPTALPTRCAC